jgi:aminopeptidase N
MDELRTAGRDRPLHFEGWKDAADALGPLPYVKGALFLHRLRTEVGDELFWHGLAIYTRRHAGQLVDSADFQRDFQEATRRDLSALFGQQVFGR